MSNTLEELLANLQMASQSVAESLESHPPEFELEVGWASTYDDLFASRVRTMSETSVLDAAMRHGRCIIAGRGGGGKTRLLYRTMRAAAANGVICLLVNLRNWTGQDYVDWKDWTSSGIGVGASFLLERFSKPEIDALTLDMLPPTARKLLIVDGLNEITSDVGQQILTALNDFAGDQIGLSVLVADRMTRRELPSPHRWALAKVLPMSAEKIAKHYQAQQLGGGAADELSIPFFLDAAMRSESLGQSKYETHSKYLLDHGVSTEQELQALSAAAYQLYSDYQSRTFPLTGLSQLVGNDVCERLRDAQVVVSVGGDDAQFSHHLLHDFLSARYVVGLDDKEWSTAVLNAVSFNGGSFDAISMVLSQLKQDVADRFLRRLYDWNLYAAGYALSDLGGRADGPSREMQAVILAMLAEKRFDLVEPTRQRANDALSLIEAPIAGPIKASDTMSALFSVLQKMESHEEWFRGWTRLFTTTPEESVFPDDLKLIQVDDSIAGWTMANVGRRVRLDGAQQKELRASLGDASAVVRWRIAHLLGAHPSPENARALWTLLKDDKDRDVRYGAVRSLVETAARTPDADLREEVVNLLVERGPSVAAEKRVKDELKRALLVTQSEAPSDWLGHIREVVRGVYVAETSATEREAWREYIDFAEIRYRPRS